MSRPCRVVLPLLAVLPLSGCGADDPSAATARFQLLDSAGVAMAVNRVPPEGLPTFTVSREAPTLVLEGAGRDGTPPFLEVAGVVSLTRDLVAVADRVARTVSFHGTDGSFAGVVDFTRPEHGSLSELARMGWAGADTVWVADPQRGQVALLTPRGLYVRDPFPPGLTVAGRFADGAYLMVPLWSTSLLGDEVREGVRRDSGLWARWWPDRIEVQELGFFPHDEVMVVGLADGMVAAVPPFGRRTSRAVDAHGFVVGDQESFRIAHHGSDGSLRRVTSVEGIDLTLTEELKLSVRPPRSEGDTALVDRLWAGVPARRPAFSRLLLGRDGRLWVAEHVAGDEPPVNWMVFSSEGEALGLVEVPAGFQLHEAGSDYVLGSEPSAGGQRVVRYSVAIGA